MRGIIRKILAIQQKWTTGSEAGPGSISTSLSPPDWMVHRHKQQPATQRIRADGPRRMGLPTEEDRNTSPFDGPQTSHRGCHLRAIPRQLLQHYCPVATSFFFSHLFNTFQGTSTSKREAHTSPRHISAAPMWKDAPWERRFERVGHRRV